MARVLSQTVARRIACTCPIADEVLLWEYLVDHLDPAHFHVEGTDIIEEGFARETELWFVSELDARRFELWAGERGFGVRDLPLPPP